jgi:hypothetical protein
LKTKYFQLPREFVELIENFPAVKGVSRVLDFQLKSGKMVSGVTVIGKEFYAIDPTMTPFEPSDIAMVEVPEED